jgi:hypothetical protein
MQPYILGLYVNEHYALLAHTLALKPQGIALEFGVGGGDSLRLIAAHMPVIGFDSFQGLPEDWRAGYPKGMFAQPEPPIVQNATIVVGLFQDTLPTYPFDDLDIGLLHLDADLFSSTKTVLEHVGPHLKPGCYIVFDEWFGYDGSDQHEQKAWREYADATGISWTVVGHSEQAWAIRIGDRDA